MKNSSQTYSHSGVNKGILFVLICVNYLFILIPRLALAINADQIMDFFKIDPIGLGILASIYFYPYSLMQIPAGLFADLIKPEVLIVVSLFAGSMGNLLFILAPRFLLAIASRFIAGLTSSLIYIPSLRLLAAKYPPEKFGQVSGTLLAMSSLAIILVNGPLVLVSEAYGWRAVFLIPIVANLTICAIFLVVFRSALKERKVNNIHLRQRISEMMRSVRTIFTNKRAWPMYVRGFISGGVNQSFQSLWAGPYLMIVLGMSRIEAGKTLVMMSLGTLIAGPIGGYLSDRVFKSRRKLSILAISLSTLCWLPLILMVDTISVAALRVLLFLMLFVRGLSMGPQTAQVKEVHHPSLAGVAMGTNNLFLTGGSAILPMVFGFMLGKEIINPQAQFRNAFLVNFCCMLVASVAAFISTETFKGVPQKEEAGVNA